MRHYKKGRKEEDLPVLECERNSITQVVINLLTNARDAMPAGGEITIRTRYEIERECVVLEVTDTGSGISKELRTKIFDPFFTTKQVGEGTGLGLSIVLGIIQAHGGEIEVDSAPRQGTVIRVYLPEKPPGKPVSGEIGRRLGRYDAEK